MSYGVDKNLKMWKFISPQKLKKSYINELRRFLWSDLEMAKWGK